MRGDVIVVAAGLVVALAFSNLVKEFTDNIINPSSRRHKAVSKVPAWAGNWSTAAVSLSEHRAFISAIIYFVVFMAVVYS